MTGMSVSLIEEERIKSVGKELRGKQRGNEKECR